MYNKLRNTSIKLKMTIIAMIALIGFSSIVFSNYSFFQDTTASLEEIQQEVAIGVVKEEDLSVGKQQMDKKQEVQKLVESMATGLVTLTVGNMDPHLSHKINKSMLHIFHGHEESVHEHSNPHGMDHHPTDGQY